MSISMMMVYSVVGSLGVIAIVLILAIVANYFAPKYTTTRRRIAGYQPDKPLHEGVAPTSEFEPQPTHFDRIVSWNDSRGLLDGEYDRDGEVLNILEECVEILLDVASNDARVVANSLLNHLTTHHKYVHQSESSAEIDIDGFCDITTFATGAVRKRGYCMNTSMDETIKEITSRTGSIIDGKFQKDMSAEAVNGWCKADYSKAKLLGVPYWMKPAPPTPPRFE